MAAPAYGFRIGAETAGPMQQAIGAGDVGKIRKLLQQRLPAVAFGTEEVEEETVEKPEETTGTPVAMTAGEDEEKTKSTKDIYEEYLTTMPAAVRGLVTTDYKGTRGGRLGEGGVSTLDLTPGTTTVVKKEEKTETTPKVGSSYTYNAPVIGGDWMQYYGDYYAGDVYHGPKVSSSEDRPQAPAAPAKPAPSLNQQIAARAITQAKQQGYGAGVASAAKSVGNPSTINRAELTALKSSGLSNAQILQRAKNQGLKLTEEAKKALRG